MADITKREIVEELKESYLDYAMSVIVSRALPDVRDGLKPVHRRILWAMWEDGLTHLAKYRKSANVIGQVLGRYHPHGDIAVYDALVRMAQDFSLRYPLIDGQGNWGSVDGDSAAAYRYCVTGNTLVVTDRGLLPIQEISNEGEEINIKILSKDGAVNRASKWFNSGVHPTVRIITKNGYELQGSLNHPVLTFRKSATEGAVFAWKTLKEIVAGDFAVLDRTENVLWPAEELDITSHHTAESSVTLPKRLGADLGFILGALLSEGFVGEKKIEFCNTDAAFLHEFQERWRRVFPAATLHRFARKPSSYGRKPYVRLECHYRDVVRLLAQLGLERVKSARKKIPWAILRSPKHVLVEFLKAYFEGDGGMIRGEKRFDLFACSASAELIKGLQILLLRFGIVSSRRYDKSRNLHALFVRGKSNLLKFYNEIGFCSLRKKGKLAERLRTPSLKEFSVTDFVPFVSAWIRDSIGYSGFVARHNFDRYPAMQANSGRICAIVERKRGLNLSPFFEYFLRTRYAFECVARVEKGESASVYSIRVESACHSFVANGFINHNTESRLSRIAEEILLDVEKETVEWQPNYDAVRKEPKTLPGKLPNLLLNGSLGIAVGMTTNIPPHNLSELADAIVHLAEHPNAGVEELLEFVKGPDFPTGGVIYDRKAIAQAYATGRGTIPMRAKAEVKEREGRKGGGGFDIVVSEIPYQVNKAELIETIATLVQEKKIEGIKDVRDESDKEGLRIVVELKGDAPPQKILNQLYSHTDLQKDFHMNLVALRGGIQPELLSLKDILAEYLAYRREVIRRRTQFDLTRAEERAHILTGLSKALSAIDKVIAAIKKSRDREDAKEKLMKLFAFTELQANAILEMRLQTLAALEREKIEAELKEKLTLIKELGLILKSPGRITTIVKGEVQELKEKYGDARRTQVVASGLKEFSEEDLIPEEAVVVALSRSGYVKRIPPTAFRAQKRGGKGLIGSDVAEEDFVTHFLSAGTHDHLLFFTDRGRVFATRAYEIPAGTRTSKGKAIHNFLELPTEEKVSAIVAYRGVLKRSKGRVNSGEGFLVMATEKGLIKKTPINAFENIRRTGIMAIDLKKEDALRWVLVSSGGDEILLTTRLGQAIRFKESQVRSMSRAAAGIRAVRLKPGDAVAGFDIIKLHADSRGTVAELRGKENSQRLSASSPRGSALLVVMENGFAKLTSLKHYKVQNRGGSGIKTAKITKKTGPIIASKVVGEEQEILALSAKGQVIRTELKEVRETGRDAQGVRIMRLASGDRLAGIVVI